MVDSWLRIRKNADKSEIIVPESPLEGSNSDSVPPETTIVNGHTYVHVAGCSCRKMENLNPACEFEDGWCVSHTSEYHCGNTLEENVCMDNCSCK